MLSRRSVLKAAAGLPLSFIVPLDASAAPRSEPPLGSLTAHAKPIGIEERHARLGKLQALMAQRRLGALLIEPGSSLEYFTGIRWSRSERTTAAIILARGPIYVVTPAFEEPSVRETLQVEGNVRPWNEHENPFELIVQCMRDAGLASGSIAAESTMRFFIVAGIRAASSAYEIVPADEIVRACRLIKSAAELELMRIANEVTLSALRYAHARTAKGMTGEDFSALVNKATIALGGQPEFQLALLNEASAFPHGSVKRQVVREGSVILMDCGCTVHGYQSDISRTWVYGEPSARQRKVWATIRRGQDLALETAKLGVPVGKIDDAVRTYYESEGWGPGYKLPGLSHRTGHGIGLDGHEPPYLVHGDATLLEAGMCFSDEPGIYMPGEFGMRLEDCWYMADSGPKTFTRFAQSLEHPV